MLKSINNINWGTNDDDDGDGEDKTIAVTVVVVVAVLAIASGGRAIFLPRRNLIGESLFKLI